MPLILHGDKPIKNLAKPFGAWPFRPDAQDTARMRVALALLEQRGVFTGDAAYVEIGLTPSPQVPPVVTVHWSPTATRPQGHRETVRVEWRVGMDGWSGPR